MFANTGALNLPKYGPLLISTETTRTANNLILLREAGKKRRRRRIGGKGKRGREKEA